MQRLRTHTETPSGNYRYVHAETGHVTTHVSRDEWIAETIRYRKVNNFPIGADFEKSMEDQLCQTLPTGWCEQEKGAAWFKALGVVQMTLETVKNGTKVLGTWMTTGMPRVPKAEANARAKVCMGCHFRGSITDCASCGQQSLNALIAGLVGGEATDYDGQLQHCQICHCSLRAKVQIPSDILFAKTDQATLDRLPEWCWAKPKEESAPP